MEFDEFISLIGKKLQEMSQERKDAWILQDLLMDIREKCKKRENEAVQSKVSVLKTS